MFRFNAFSKSNGVKCRLNSVSISKTGLKPLDLEDPFRLNNIFSVHDMFNSRCHFGHKSILRNTYMSDYLYGSRQGIDIFDLDISKKNLILALNFIAHIASKNGIILFFSSDKMIIPLVERTAKECGEYAFCRGWTGSPFLNSKFYYKETVRLPDLVVALNTLSPISSQHEVVKESAKMLIPTVGIVDSNCDPRLVSYPIPGNDDSITSIQFYCSLFKEAILRGKNFSSQ